MTEWKEYTVQDLIDLNMIEEPMDGNHGGIHPKTTDYVPVGVPFIMANNLVDGGVDLENCSFITEEQANSLRKGFAHPGDVLLTHKATIGRTAIVPDKYPVIILTPQVTYYRIKKDINKGYLKYYFDSPDFQNTLSSWANSGSTRAYLGITAQHKLPVVLPSLEIQDKIASILSAIDDKIQNNKQINRNLLDQANTFFQSWFVEYEPFGGSRPDDWKEGILEDIIEFSNGYAFKSKELLNEPDSERDCYHVFKQGHINRGGGFNITGTKSWYPKDLAKNLQKYVLQKGDVLMAMTDMKDNVAILGNTAVMEIEGEYIVNQRVGLIRPTGIYGIQYPYIALLTNSYDFLKDLRSRANSGVQVNLSSNEIRNSSIYIAPESVNKEFNELVMPLFEAMIVNDIENLRLADLRDELLPKLISGELDISDMDI